MTAIWILERLVGSGINFWMAVLNSSSMLVQSSGVGNLMDLLLRGKPRSSEKVAIDVFVPPMSIAKIIPLL